MSIPQIFLLQFVLSITAWSVVARAVFAPRLAQLTPARALFWLSLPHAFRHVGMAFLVPYVAGDIPQGFAQFSQGQPSLEADVHRFTQRVCSCSDMSCVAIASLSIASRKKTKSRSRSSARCSTIHSDSHRSRTPWRPS